MFSVVPVGDPKWVAAVMALGSESRDIHLDQRLLVPYVVDRKWHAFLGLTDTKSGYVVQPFLITQEGELRNAYNFGGPVPVNDEIFAQEHVDNVNNWAVKHGLRSQYATLIPSLAEKQVEFLKKTDVIVERKKESVIVDLNDFKMRGTTRRTANKAQSAGVLIKEYQLDRIKDFVDIYNAAMDRKDAKGHWRFSSKWFELFGRFVKPLLLLAEYENKIEAGCLVAYSQQYPVAYYHFAATYGKHPNLGVNHMLLSTACEVMKNKGFKYLYLGGGLTNSSDDSLLIFKSGFSKKRLPVFTYKICY